MSTKNKSVYGKTCELPLTDTSDFRNLINKRTKSDGITFLNRLPDNSIHAGFFDPQYRGVLDKLGYGNEGSRQKGRADLEQMSVELINDFSTQLSRVIVPSGHMFLWVDKFHLVEGVSSLFTDTDFEIVDHIVWNKDRMGMGYRSRRQSEHLIILQNKPKRAKGVWAIHNIPDVWTEKPIKGHAHSKPIPLQKRLMDAVVPPGGVVIDPCAGSFSVYEAAKEAGCDFVGCDINGYLGTK